MKLKDLPDDFTREQFMQLDKESLDAVPYIRRRWLCQVKNCTNGTHVRDYGLEPFNGRGIWALLDRNGKGITKNPRDWWVAPNNYWLCGKHKAMFKRLKNHFDFDHIWRRFIDTDKIVVLEIPGTDGLDTVKQIETK